MHTKTADTGVDARQNQHSPRAPDEKAMEEHLSVMLTGTEEQLCNALDALPDATTIEGAIEQILSTTKI